MKLRATTYTFDASAKTIDCALFTSLEAIQLITNVTDNIIIYNFADATKGGTLASTTLTLTYDTTSMSDTDKLMILVEDGTDSVGIDDGGNSITVDATSLPLPTGASTAANQTTIIGHLDGVEGLLTTIDADTGNLPTIKTNTDSLAVVGGGLESSALRVTLANDSTGVLSVDDNGSSLTVDGTVTANLSAIDNAVLDQIELNQDSQTALLTTIDADTSALAGAVSGTEVQVDVLTMPTTTVQATNLDIRDLTATDQVTIADIKDGAGDSVMDATNNAVKVNVVAGGAGDGSILDGVSSSIKATVKDLTNSNPLTVAIVDGTGDQITSFGGGTQYTEGDIDATLTGTISMAEGPSNTATPLQVDASSHLQIDIAATSTDITVQDGGGSLTVDNNGTFATQVTSVVPGTGATNLGKAKDSAVGSTDTGVAALARLRYTAAHSSGSDGNYDTLDLTSWHELRTRDQRALDLQNCNDINDFTALNSDTNNLANSVDHVFGTGAISFDKVNGAANTVFGAVSFATSSVNISDIFEDGSFVTYLLKVSSVADIDYAFIRLGTDASNYNEWRWDVSELTASVWNILRQPTAHPDSYAGNGWNSSDIDYGVVGIAFNSETNTLSGIKVDHIGFLGGRITDTTIDASVTSSVNTPNINVHRVGGQPTDTSSGNLSAGTLRVAIATDDVNTSAQTTALQLIDDTVATTASAIPTKGIAISGTDGTNARVIKTDTSGELQVDVLTMPTTTVTATNLSTNIAQMNGVTVTMGNGVSGTGVQRVTLASDSTGNIASIGTSVTPGTAAANLGKARDAVAGVSDTGIAHYYVRRDTPTAVTPAAGDYEIAQISANGEQWVRLAGELADDSAFTVATTRVVPVGHLADETSTDSVDEGDIGIPRMTLDRKAIVTTSPSATVEGLDIFRSIDLDETEEDIKTSAGRLYAYYFANTSSSARYLKLYNATAANVTVGTTTPVVTLYLPATSAGHVGLPYPVAFSTAITAAATTGVADNDTGAPGANEVIFNAFYK